MPLWGVSLSPRSPPASAPGSCSSSDGLDDSGERHGTWQERKQAYVDGLPDKSLDALLVTAADKTHNGLCIAADVRRYGREFWSTFNAGPDELPGTTPASATSLRRGSPTPRSRPRWTGRSQS